MKLDLKEWIAKVIGQCGVVLFDNDTQALAGAITLSDSAANYDKLTICYRTGDNSYGSVDVVHPNGKKVDLIACLVFSGAFYLKSKTVEINGTSINTAAISGYATGEGYLYSGGGVQITVGDYLGITQVIGYVGGVVHNLLKKLTLERGCAV